MLDISLVPQELRERPQWLVWRFEPGKKKPLKVPYWTNGSKRFGVQGDAKDRQNLVTLEQALAALNAPRENPFTGIGFAFLPDDGLIGIDIDKCIDLDTGEISPMASGIINACQSYTELSPSGTGVHIIVAGHTETFKSNKIGLEVFCSSQYFTFTCKHYSGMPFAIAPISEPVLAKLRVTVKGAPESKPERPNSPVPLSAADDLVRLEAALSFVSPDGHDEWIRVGMGLFSTLGESGFRLWDYWSSKSENYGGSEECRKRWTSFGKRGTQITAATVYKLAIDGGWKPPRSLMASPISPRLPPKSPAPPVENVAGGVSPVPPQGDDSSADQHPQSEGEDLAGVETPVKAVAEGQDNAFADAIDEMAAFYNDMPELPAGYGDTPDFFDQGAGEVRGKKERPKKVYGADHWDRVADVLENFTLIYGEDLVWDVRESMLMRIPAMRQIVQDNDVMKFWGGEARRWALKKNIVFDPKETPSPARSGPTATINLFSGWKMKPKQGKCTLIQALLLHLVDANDEMAMWILRWLAYPLRNPGAKMETSIIMHGDEGSGKNFFFEKVVKAIYGQYGYVIGNAQLEANFNDWASMKLFLVADEVVTKSELRQMKGKLKYLVSGDTIIINPKGLPEHSEANQMNFVFLSNELIPLALDKTDRRYLVVWTPPALDKDFYVSVAEEIAAGGIEAFYYFLMHELDMGDFNEHTKPLYNDAKDRLIEKSLAPSERFYREWSQGLLPLPFITCGVIPLYEAFQIWCGRSGESRYTSMTNFSPAVERYAGDIINKKAIKYEYGETVKQRLVFCLGTQPEGKSLREWAEATGALFETALHKYKNRGGADVEG